MTLIAAIKQVEDRADYGLTPIAWKEVKCAYPTAHIGRNIGEMRDHPEQAKLCASKNVLIIIGKLNRRKIPATPANIYAVWKLGWRGFAECGLNLDHCAPTTRQQARTVAELCTDMKVHHD